MKEGQMTNHSTKRLLLVRDLLKVKVIKDRSLVGMWFATDRDYCLCSTIFTRSSTGKGKYCMISGCGYLLVNSICKNGSCALLIMTGATLMTSIAGLA